MTQQSCSKPQVDRVRLASYLTVSVAGGLLATATSEAAIVMIDLTNVDGQDISAPNGGVSVGGMKLLGNPFGAGSGIFKIYNSFNTDNYWGFDGDVGLSFAVNGGFASPRNFGSAATIDSAASFNNDPRNTAFKYVGNYGGSGTSPDFGANSFVGFRFGSAGSYNYGYLEVTWTASTNTFQILSGAYESTVNTGILAGATAGGGAVPVPAASLLALMALGGNSFRRSRARAA